MDAEYPHGLAIMGEKVEEVAHGGHRLPSSDIDSQLIRVESSVVDVHAFGRAVLVTHFYAR